MKPDTVLPARREDVELHTADGLRLVVYDATQRQRQPKALGLSWQYGTHLYRALGRVDAAYGATSFADALEWLRRHDAARTIGEVQFWGHGKWGRIFIDGEALDRSVLRPHAGWMQPVFVELQARRNEIGNPLMETRDQRPPDSHAVHFSDTLPPATP